MALTKDKLTAHLQTQIGMTKLESRQIVEQLFASMKTTQADGEDLLVSGFGKFQVREKKERRGRNPQTRESLILKARKVLVFKTSGVLRERVNGGRVGGIGNF
jgi:integration host factor subunit alpha